MQLRAGGHTPRQLRLDVHVNVFQFRLPLKLSVGDLPTDVVESFDDGHLFVPGEHGDFPEHRGVRDGAENVVPPEPPVERNGLGEMSDIGAGRAEKPSTA